MIEQLFDQTVPLLGRRIVRSVRIFRHQLEAILKSQKVGNMLDQVHGVTLITGISFKYFSLFRSPKRFIISHYFGCQFS